MKKILITGKNSYIGNSFKKWLEQWPEDYQVDEVDTRNNIWREADFSQYDSILHVAGIAHNSSDPKLKELYYQVNTDLTYEVARKAKKEKVKQFVFMSSMIVYGSKNKVITKKTEPDPDNFYGDSKLQAEKKLSEIESESFKVAIIRPPMVYGKDSKGNYPKLAKFAKISPIFPDYDNKRSMIHIDNLCEFLRLIIKNQDQGIFHPQNKEYVKTSDMVKKISEVHNKKIVMTRIFNPIIKLVSDVSIINKVFGDSVYNYSINKLDKCEYNVKDFEESIKASIE